MAEELLRAHLKRLGVDARVRSAGTMPWGGSATSAAIEVMGEYGLDITGHESTALNPALIERSDLVLGMTRDHVGRVANLVPDAAERAFLAGELARLGAQTGRRTSNEPLRVWAQRVARSRDDSRIVGRFHEEVADPVGEPIEVYRLTAARLDRDLRSVAQLLAERPADL
jgi:protein-tyrosine-phosphatase